MKYTAKGTVAGKKYVLKLNFYKDERDFWKDLASRTKLTPEEMMLSVLRRHIKSRYQFPRKEWYYVYGKK